LITDLKIYASAEEPFKVMISVVVVSVDMKAHVVAAVNAGFGTVMHAENPRFARDFA
jgi:hypothetical protein